MRDIIEDKMKVSDHNEKRSINFFFHRYHIKYEKY